MMEKDGKIVAVCGLICTGCEIMEATTDKDLARKIADEFRELFGKEFKFEDIHCGGCRGDRTKHWSPDCWILKCCVDEKGLKYCYECTEFPCSRLEEWAKQRKEYGAALQRLKEMKGRNG